MLAVKFYANYEINFIFRAEQSSSPLIKMESASLGESAVVSPNATSTSCVPMQTYMVAVVRHRKKLSTITSL